MGLDCRLMIDPPAPGAWNMAVDEALLDSALKGVATLRFYQWSEPTLSLGYFQSYEDRQLHTTSQPLPVVRRRTGGGALVHDRELTYSLALPPGVGFAQDSLALVCDMHGLLIEALEELSDRPLLLTTCGSAIAVKDSDEPFLCFQRRARGDLIWQPSEREGRVRTADGNHKVCGSAQRKSRGAILQHGGLLLGQSAHAEELPGLLELSGTLFETDSLTQAICSKISNRFDLRLESQGLTSDEKRLVEEAERVRFTASDWIKRR